MLALLPACADWLAEGRPFAVATIIAAEGSAPRPVGTAMAVDAAGEVRGSLSGGCIEAEVFETCLEVLRTGSPQRRRYGYSDADAFAVGLACGGEVEVQVQCLAADPALQEAARTGTGALVWDLADPRPRLVDGTEPDPQVRAFAAAGRSGLVPAGGCPPEDPRAGPELFVVSHLPAPRLIVFGANDFAAALVSQAKLAGYDVTLCDARGAFATPQRFPAADRVVVAWPDRYLSAERDAGRIDVRTAVCVLTHDAKFDVPLLELVLSLPAAYIGAMGSRRTHAQREAALRARGVSAAQLARLHSPIGLDLGAVTPQEVAVSILAEIIATRTGRLAAAPLSTTPGPIHVRPAATVLPWVSLRDGAAGPLPGP